ncbi:redoxin domain-containing protein [uncultured Pseudokineococcus sp.]|uniref:redoxin domain-containing protein n=1 Tax=uncultured Pseudokineococcus sp. TaxID=1642928 RepID=UPI00261230FB|nr:redoxin domain-containing protein [uncultured Pseudokineococcus sp.]
MGGRVPASTVHTAADGSVVALGHDLPEGVRGRLVVFLPFASSPVCTGEVGELRDRAADLAAAGLDVVALTCDAVPALAAWVRAERLPFPVLSDFWPHGAAAGAWGVLDPASGAPRRVTFLVCDGRVLWRDEAPPGRARSLDDALDAARRLLPEA